jgi:hypothetical protein
VIHRLSWPVIQVVADVPPLFLGAIIAVGLVAWHGLEGVGAWNELDREERLQALRVVPAEVDRRPTRARMTLRMVATGLAALAAIAPNPLLLAASIVVGLVTYLRITPPGRLMPAPRPG